MELDALVVVYRDGVYAVPWMYPEYLVIRTWQAVFAAVDPYLI
jgi:hypothetical protein